MVYRYPFALVIFLVEGGYDPARGGVCYSRQAADREFNLEFAARMTPGLGPG